MNDQTRGDNEATGRQPLAGVKVVDFTWVIAGPASTAVLGDHGAQVIHVESPHRPDPTRTGGPFKDRKAGLNRSAMFANFNRNKYSLCISLDHPDSKPIIEKLVKWADIVAECFTPGVMERRGLGYNDLAKLNPGLIMISLSMQGHDGPMARMPGFGDQLAALAGFVNLTGWPDRDPLIPFSAYTDTIVPYFAAAAILAGLDYRSRTGKGQYIDMSHMETGLQFLAPPVLDFVTNSRDARRAGNRCDRAVPHGVFHCKGNDRWCAIAVTSDEDWMGLCRAIGNPAWTAKPEFGTFLGRKQREDELDRLLGEWTSQHTAEEIMNVLQGCGVPAGVVQNSKDLHEDPQLAHREHFWIINHPEMGLHSCDAPAFKLMGTPADLRSPAPCFGQDNEYICTKLLGFPDEDFVALSGSGVFG